MRRMIEKAIVEKRFLWFNIPGGAAVLPTGYVSDGFYEGVVHGRKFIFHEDEVREDRRI